MKLVLSNLADPDFSETENDIFNLDLFKQWNVRLDSVIFGSDGIVITIMTPRPTNPSETFSWSDAKRHDLESALKDLGHDVSFTGFIAAHREKLSLYLDHN